MTPAQVETASRRRYNSENSTFWSQDEIFKVIYEAEQELAVDCFVIEAKDISTTTVSGTQTYSLPSLFIAVKRIEWNGTKLEPIDFRQDDQLTMLNASTTATGTPQYWFEWNGSVYLRPIPNDAQTLTIYGYKEATLLTTSSTTLDVPVRTHTALINFVCREMAGKDENWAMYDRFDKKWEADKLRIRQFEAKRKRRDGFAVVKDEESLSTTLLGSL